MTTRDELVRRYIEVRNLEFLAKRMIGAALAGRPPGAEGSVVKLAWSQTGQALANTGVDVIGGRRAVGHVNAVVAFSSRSQAGPLR